MELEKLLGDLLDAMPRLGPAFGRSSVEDRRTVDLRASVSEQGVVHERRTPTAKPGRDDDERPDLLCGKSVANLAAGIEGDRLGLEDRNDFPDAQPSLPGAPQPTPSLPGSPRLPSGPLGGSGNYAVSAAANEHAAFLWVVDNIQHSVVLCEKTDGGRDFTCAKKPLP